MVKVKNYSGSGILVKESNDYPSQLWFICLISFIKIGCMQFESISLEKRGTFMLLAPFFMSVIDQSEKTNHYLHCLIIS